MRLLAALILATVLGIQSFGVSRAVELLGWTKLAQRTDEIAPYLPPASQVSQVVSDGDTDGDGQPDTVALYSYMPAQKAPFSANVLVLSGPSSARTASHLLGGPANTTGAPTLAGGGSAELVVRDLNGDGQAEIAMGVSRKYPNPQQLLWIFRWDGIGHRTEIALDGVGVTVLEPSSGQEAGVRVQSDDRRWSSDDQVGLSVEETFRWRNGGYRLTERTLALPAGQPSPPVTHPEIAVLLFYQAIGRGEIQAAYNMLGPTFRASQPFDQFAGGYSTTREVRVEEIRGSRPFWDQRSGDNSDGPVYVRIVATDERPAGRTTTSYSGTWRVVSDGGVLRLEGPDIRPSVSLAAISDAVPPGWMIQQTAQGDLRNSGVDDLAVVARPIGLYDNAEPMLLLRSGTGFEATPVGELVADQGIGGPGGDIGIEDVTGDGRPELVYGGVVGAHSSVFWVFGWNGRALAPLFEGFSNSAGLGLRDLDGDGPPEILMLQSGYCGSYAGSPSLLFAFRWREGAYWPATAELPTLQGSVFFERASEALAETEAQAGDQNQVAARACMHHMVATGHAFAGRPHDAWEAYQRYHVTRLQVNEQEKQVLYALPGYVGAPFFEEQVRDMLERAESGRLGSWSPSELAFLHDLLGNAFEAQGDIARHRPETGSDANSIAETEAGRGQAAQAVAAAQDEYQVALALDPDDREASAALDRLGP